MDGNNVSLKNYKGKTLLIVNMARNDKNRKDC
jgi:glutathione peroxidase-family protein